jgi:MFS family permease
VVLSWGIVASSQALATSFTTLLIARIILGFSEAAFTGVPFYLSFFYRREELAFRTGIFISAAPLATSFASSLAWVITWVAQKFDLIAPWRLLFLVEGFPSVLVAWYCYTHVADGPGCAWFFNKRERKVAVARLDTGGQCQKLETEWNQEPKTSLTTGKGIQFSEIVDTFKDLKSYLTAVSFSHILAQFQLIVLGHLFRQ